MNTYNTILSYFNIEDNDKNKIIEILDAVNKCLRTVSETSSDIKKVIEEFDSNDNAIEKYFIELNDDDKNQIKLYIDKICDFTKVNREQVFLNMKLNNIMAMYIYYIMLCKLTKEVITHKKTHKEEYQEIKRYVLKPLEGKRDKYESQL